MSVRIRLSRGGSKKRPFYKIVVADKRSPRDGRFIEKVGFYNPLLPKEHKERLVIQADKIKEWLSKGAEPTDRVARMLAEFGLCEKPAIPAQTKKAAPKAKAVERAKAKEEAIKAKAEAEAAAKAEAEAKAAEEAAAAKAAAEEAAAAPAEEAAAPAEEAAAAPAEEAPAC